MSKRPLVMFSPMPPLQNGIADYTASFIKPLADQYDLYVVTPNGSPVVDDTGFTMLSSIEYNNHQAAFRNIGHAYQIGNNHDHVYAFGALTRTPGLVTVHDLSIQHLVNGSSPGGAAGEAYFELIFEAYGKYGLEIARDVPRWHRQTPTVHGELGLLPALAMRSRGLVTHSAMGKLRLLACNYDRPVYLIPHHYQERIDDISGSREERRRISRSKLGLPDDVVIILSLGFVTKAKCVHLTVQALASLAKDVPQFLFVIAGQINNDEADIEAEISRSGIADKILVQGYVADSLMLDYLAACDILVNLRYPTLGESSGSLTNGLGMGCCTVITDIGTFSEVPGGCAVKISVEEMTRDGIAARLLPIISSRHYRVEVERNARRFAELNLKTEYFLERYVNALETSIFSTTIVSVSSFLENVTTLTSTSRRAIEDLAKGLLDIGLSPRATMWWRELLLPVSDNGILLLNGGEFEVDLARLGFDWTDISHVERHDSSNDVSVALVIQGAREFLENPVDALVKAGRSLKRGGTLVLNLVDTDGGCCSEMWAVVGGDGEAGLLNAAWRSGIATLCEQAGLILTWQVSAFSEIADVDADVRAPAEVAIVARRGSLEVQPNRIVAAGEIG